MDTMQANSSMDYRVRQRAQGECATLKLFKNVLYLAVMILILGGGEAAAQGVGISESAIVPDNSAILELRSTTRGFLLPRNTSISTTAAGLIFYNTSTERIDLYDGSSWLQVPATSDNLGVFASTTSAQLASVLTDETGTGSAVFSASPSLTTPALGVASATSINKVSIAAPANSATLALADGSTLATSGANPITLTSTGATNVTLPTSGTLSTVREMYQLTSDFSTTSTTSTDVTGLANFSLEANSTYYFMFKCLVTTNATTRGMLLSVNATPQVYASINYIHMYPTSATAFSYEQVTGLQGGTVAANGPGTTPRECTLEGTIVTSSAVTIALQCQSEAAGTAFVRAGSFGWFKKIQ